MEETKKLMPVGELFKKSFEIYKTKMWRLALITLVGLVGVVVALPFLAGAGIIAYRNWPNGNITLLLVAALLFLIGVLIMIFAGLWSRVAMFCAAWQDLQPKQAFKDSWPKMASFFWISLLFGLAAMGGMILLVIPGIIFAVWFGLAEFIFIAEGTKGTAALKESKRLVKGRWWPIFGRIMIIFAISIVLSWFKIIGSLVSVFILSPFTVVYIFELYKELKASAS